MADKKYFCNFDDSPLNRPVCDPAPDGSGLMPCAFVARFIPDKADPSTVIYDIFSETTHEFGASRNEVKRLRSMVSALKPHLFELRQSWLDLSRLLPAESSDDKMEVARKQKFLASWLEMRCKEAFDAICDLPVGEMSAAALAFKPTGANSFAMDLSRNGYIIRLIPEPELTDEHCMLALAESPGALQYIPAKRRTREICLHAMSIRKVSLGALKHVPVEIIDAEICMAAAISDEMNLKHIPPSFRTGEIYLNACLASGLAWEEVPKEFRTLELEFCASLHNMGLFQREGSKIYADMLAADPSGAKERAERLSDAYLRMNFLGADVEELGDMGYYFSESSKQRESSPRG